MTRAVVNVATDSWTGGQARLRSILDSAGEQFIFWNNALPPGSPPHREYGYCAGPAEKCVPYAFKAYALKAAVEQGAEVLLWADACIVPIRPLEPLWERIERDGYWFSRQGYSNDQWTCDSAYKDLFPEMGVLNIPLDAVRLLNSTIPHVVATAFGINVRHSKGQMFLNDYFALASKSKAFCGPWQNSASPLVAGRNTDRPAAPCGPAGTLGHRHDQTAASVIAWRLAMELTNPPEIFSYKGGEIESTILVADGSY